MNYQARIKAIEKACRRIKRQAQAETAGPLRFSRGGLVGGGNMNLTDFEKSYAAYKKSMRRDKH